MMCLLTGHALYIEPWPALRHDSRGSVETGSLPDRRFLRGMRRSMDGWRLRQDFTGNYMAYFFVSDADE